MPRVGIATFSPCSMSATLRLRSASWTADLTSARARPRNRCRLLRLLPFGLGRRSTIFIALPPGEHGGSLPRLVHPHIPLDEPPHLPLGVAARHHALEEVAMLLFGLRILFRAETDHRQQVLDLREHAAFDDLAQLFVRSP